MVMPDGVGSGAVDPEGHLGRGGDSGHGIQGLHHPEDAKEEEENASCQGGQAQTEENESKATSGHAGD